MISQSAEYALRAVVCLALHPGQPLTNRQIAEAAQIPPGYLAKILTAMARAGMVGAQRGLNGGFVLARPAEELTLLEVVQTADPSRRIHTCPLGISGHGQNLCSLHRHVDEAIGQAEQVLARTSVADVLRDAGEPLCPVHCTHSMGRAVECSR